MKTKGSVPRDKYIVKGWYCSFSDLFFEFTAVPVDQHLPLPTDEEARRMAMEIESCIHSPEYAQQRRDKINEATVVVVEDKPRLRLVDILDHRLSQATRVKINGEWYVGKDFDKAVENFLLQLEFPTKEETWSHHIDISSCYAETHQILDDRYIICDSEFIGVLGDVAEGDIRLLYAAYYYEKHQRLPANPKPPRQFQRYYGAYMYGLYLDEKIKEILRGA